MEKFDFEASAKHIQQRKEHQARSPRVDDGSPADITWNLSSLPDAESSKEPDSPSQNDAAIDGHCLAQNQAVEDSSTKNTIPSAQKFLTDLKLQHPKKMKATMQEAVNHAARLWQQKQSQPPKKSPPQK